MKHLKATGLLLCLFMINHQEAQAGYSSVPLEVTNAGTSQVNLLTEKELTAAYNFYLKNVESKNTVCYSSKPDENPTAGSSAVYGKKSISCPTSSGIKTTFYNIKPEKNLYTLSSGSDGRTSGKESSIFAYSDLANPKLNPKNYTKCFKSGSEKDPDCQPKVLTEIFTAAANRKCVDLCKEIYKDKSTLTMESVDQLEKEKKIVGPLNLNSATVQTAYGALAVKEKIMADVKKAADKAAEEALIKQAQEAAKLKASAGQGTSATMATSPSPSSGCFSAGPDPFACVDRGSPPEIKPTWRWQTPAVVFDNPMDGRSQRMGEARLCAKDEKGQLDCGYQSELTRNFPYETIFEQPAVDCDESTDGQLIAVDYGEKIGKRTMICMSTLLPVEKGKPYIEKVKKADIDSLKVYVARTKATYSWVATTKYDPTVPGCGNHGGSPTPPGLQGMDVKLVEYRYERSIRYCLEPRLGEEKNLDLLYTKAIWEFNYGHYPKDQHPDWSKCPIYKCVRLDAGKPANEEAALQKKKNP